MSDAEIGRFIGFESARTSRWKYGQIAVTDAERLLALAQSFDIDISILTHVAAGYISADETQAILTNEGKLIRFLGEQLLLPVDDQAISLSGGEGTVYRVIRRAAGHYNRKAKRLGNIIRDDEENQPTVLLADDDETTIEVFHNLTGPGTGVKGVVARTGPEALITAGTMSPDLIIFDLFFDRVDGFSAVRQLTANKATRDAEVFATSLSLNPDIVRSALGSGAIEVLQRPLKSRVLNRILGRV